MPPQPKLDNTHLRAICDLIGNTGEGLTGSEIGQYLKACGIADPSSGLTKRHRLFEALRTKQDADRCANNVLAFIEYVMCPVFYVGQKSEGFEDRRLELTVFWRSAALR